VSAVDDAWAVRIVCGRSGVAERENAAFTVIEMS
jgi:hypothetical protein